MSTMRAGQPDHHSSRRPGGTSPRPPMEGASITAGPPGSTAGRASPFAAPRSGLRGPLPGPRRRRGRPPAPGGRDLARPLGGSGEPGCERRLRRSADRRRRQAAHPAHRAPRTVSPEFRRHAGPSRGPRGSPGSGGRGPAATARRPPASWTTPRVTGRQPRPALGPAARQDGATGPGPHPDPEPVPLLPTAIVGLEGLLHRAPVSSHTETMEGLGESRV